MPEPLARDRNAREDYISPVRRLLIGLLVLSMLGLFAVWRIDSPRVERLRAAIIDAVVPSFDWAMAPVTTFANLISDFRSYNRIYEQNLELRRELQIMQAWREAARRLDQENAKLRDLNNLALDPQLTYISGIVLADSGSPFRQSVLLNVGARDGILDGWPTMDGMGLVGRISGVGDDTSRVILVTDTSSRIPVTIERSGQRGILAGDNTITPHLEFIEDRDRLQAGDRIVSSGDGGVFPAGLLVGHVVVDADGRLRARLAADFERLEFLRVLRSQRTERIEDPATLLAPPVWPRLPLVDDAVDLPPEAADG